VPQTEIVRIRCTWWRSTEVSRRSTPVHRQIDHDLAYVIKTQACNKDKANAMIVESMYYLIHTKINLMTII